MCECVFCLCCCFCCLSLSLLWLLSCECVLGLSLLACLLAVKARGFGFVEFEDVSDAADAIENMNGTFPWTCPSYMHPLPLFAPRGCCMACLLYLSDFPTGPLSPPPPATQNNLLACFPPLPPVHLSLTFKLASCVRVCACAYPQDAEFFGRVITVNFARALTTKLGVAKPVWGDVDEYARIKAGLPAEGNPEVEAAPSGGAGPQPQPQALAPAS